MIVRGGYEWVDPLITEQKFPALGYEKGQKKISGKAI